MDETRFAILIGINDYKRNELKYCSNDVVELKKRLVDNCLFRNENIFDIVSTNESSIPDVYLSLQQALEEIRKSFIKNVDCILFYFSGHGKFEEQTFIELHEKKIPIQEIYNLLNTLKPSHQIYILDACHSGFGIDLKSSDIEPEMKMYYNQRYIANAEGAYFLCSCRQDEKSQAFPEDKNGVFTKYVVEAIDNSNLYDENNALSISVIHEYALKKILLVGKYEQTPFIQMKSSGFYPFAFKNANLQVSTFCESIIESITNENEIESFFRRDDLNLGNDLRRDLFHFCSELALNQFGHGYSPKLEIAVLGNSINISDYSVKPFNPFTAKPTEDGIGVKIFQDFVERYKDVCDFSFTEGNPNNIKLSFSDQVHQFNYSNPCYIEIYRESVRNPSSLNTININTSCKQIVVDATRAFVWGSMGELFLTYLIKRTEDTKPFIIVKMDKNDFTKKYLLPLTNESYYSRIIIV